MSNPALTSTNAVHDEIGRGDFLALYTATGVIASLTSLSMHVLTNNLAITSLGASGAIAGIMAAWCMLHSKYVCTQLRITLF